MTKQFLYNEEKKELSVDINYIFPVNPVELDNEGLIKIYASFFKLEPGEWAGLNVVIEHYKKEIESRLESADALGLLAIAQIVEKYFPGVFDLPIRKKITYSPTGKKAPAWIGLFSRKNRGLAE